MKIKKTKKNNYKLKLTHKELAIIENALDKQDDNYLESINDKLFDKDEFKTPFEFSNFEFGLWEKIKKELSKVDPY